MTYASDQERRQSRKAADSARKQTMREQREKEAKGRHGTQG
jgi:hypothetical protein